MNIFYNIEDVPFQKESVLTIGTFDGVHLGHKQIISKLLSDAKEKSLRSLVITFEPHPQVVIQRADKPEVYLINSLKERLELFEKNGIENILIIDFTSEFSKIEAEDFIKDYLYKIGFQKIILGYDHTFGRDRQGSIDTLKKFAEKDNFEIEQIGPYKHDDKIISSTVIRKLLQASKISEANEMLGYKFFVKGKVQFGRGMGAQIGFPTANIKPAISHKLLPGFGVYIVESMIDGKLHYGIANIGLRPTMTNDIKPTLEVHYLDFDKDLYDEVIKVCFIQFIRPEIKFDSSEELAHQIRKDEKQAKRFIKHLKEDNQEL
ncbi:MAG: riboflavin biosynthesis protein RibF [Ignavibacteria bacterium GWF2_33_9]|nr:MAG: riboflavin biosynthesis protein RibF [Ignavibacteria bacterium GWF2_33_9]